MNTVADMARCCRQVVSKHQGGVQTHLGKKSNKRDADGNEIAKVVHTMSLRQIALVVLSGYKTNMTDKARILQELGLPRQHLLRSYVEEETLQPILIAFQHLAPIKQFACGKYRIDPYSPVQKVAVECDEGNHKQYDFAAEYERQRLIEQQLTCQFVRYNPHSADFSIFQLIAQLMPLLTIVKLPSYMPHTFSVHRKYGTLYTSPLNYHEHHCCQSH